MEPSTIARQMICTLKATHVPRSCAFSNSCRSIPRARLRVRPAPGISGRIQARTAKTYARPPNRIEQMVIDARVQYPRLFPFLLIASIGSVTMLTVMAYQQYYGDGVSSVYPPVVEERLRLALHYTHIEPDPETSSKYFMQAIENAEKVGMDPFSKEVLGIRIRFSQMLENFGHVKAAIEILDGVTKDLEQRLNEIDEGGPINANNASDENMTKADLRKNLIKGIIQNKVKVSSLYESDYMQDSRRAKHTLSDAVGLVVKESRNPQTNSFSDDNGAGLTTGEIAAMLSRMGDLYARTGEEENAVQVYMLTLQPLKASCNGTRSCKEVQTFSNIASAMDLALKKPNAKINGKPATKKSLAEGRRAALKWADQAIAAADVVQPADRDEICDLALLTAQMTRADLLLENGDKNKSREVFQSLLPTLKEKNLVPLIQAAEQGLKKITG
ncbi:uncharacterized protein Z518_07144 [Rhinocladiella mackenziei CBS 650.93]|uniref:Uncharacterized protein n=1 Tax=Rhinocladiella mackenziei CBS 650.93 TaxID=1442369 RepID=A0A0D2IK37_9EURO|nr:uncharacterized protein Z518_07144 [Rhinocladiella mackenziei CBS 650.93]KIX03591.1 hypothetical protein Z518_07144 [Rhinocladiella mackenziei CBS 650.93]